MSVLGIDLGSRYIKIVHADRGKNPRIRNAFMLDTPEGAISDGEIVDMMLLVSRVKTFLSEKRIKPREMSISIQSSNALIRELKLPALKKNEILPAIEFELSQTFPGIVQTHTISYQQHTGVGEPIEGISAFCPTKMLDSYVKFAGLLGIQLRSIDVSANCVSRAFQVYGEGNQTDDNVMLVDIGISGSQVTIINKGKIFLSRHVGSGARTVDEIMASRFGITLEQAERARSTKKYDLYNVQEEDMLAFARIGYSSVEDQIRQTMDFFVYNKKETIKKIYLIGGGSTFPGLDTYLKETFSIPVQPLKASIPGIKDLSIPNFFMAAVGAVLVDQSLTADIDLTPGLQIIEKTKSQTNRMALLFGCVALIALLTIGAYLFSYLNIRKENDRAAELGQDMATYSTINKLKEEIKQTKDTVEKIKAISEKAEAGSLINTELLASVGKAMPAGVFISTYMTDSSATLELAGISKDRNSIAEFLYQLKSIPQIAAADLKNVGTKTGPDGMPTDYSFSITLSVKGR